MVRALVGDSTMTSDAMTLLETEMPRVLRGSR
jgi:hypothetical protein